MNEKRVQDAYRKAVTAWEVVEDVELTDILRDDDLTRSRYAEKNELSYDIAECVLERLVRRGKLVKIICRRDGIPGRVMAYRLPLEAKK